MIFDEIRNQAKDLEPIPYAGRGRSPLTNFGLEPLLEIAHCFRPLFVGQEPSEKTGPESRRGDMGTVSI